MGLVQEINVMPRIEAHNNFNIASKRCMDQGIYYGACCHVQKSCKVLVQFHCSFFGDKYSLVMICKEVHFDKNKKTHSIMINQAMEHPKENSWDKNFQI